MPFAVNLSGVGGQREEPLKYRDFYGILCLFEGSYGGLFPGSQLGDCLFESARARVSQRSEIKIRSRLPSSFKKIAIIKRG